MSAGDRISVCVAGGGLAGSILAWRLASEHDVGHVELLLGPASRSLRDATTTSAGVVRGFDPEPSVSCLAAESLAELYRDSRLRRWARYEELGSLHIRSTKADRAAELAWVEHHLPGSAEILGPHQLRARGWAELPATASAVFEARAGRVSPGALRNELLRDLAGSRRGCLLAGSLSRLAVENSGVVRCELLDGSTRQHDVVVVATGRWSGELLRASRLDPGELETKAIEYAVWEAGGWRPPAFVDETSGLYGTPWAGNGILLGIPVERWGVDPDRPPASPESSAAVAGLAARRLPWLRLGQLMRRVVSADSYAPGRTLSLEPVDAAGTIFTFAGGSGGSIKTALAASGRAAAEIAGTLAEPATWHPSPRTREGTAL